MTRLLPLTFLLALAACATQTPVQNPQVGGAQMYPSKTMLANLSESGDHNRLIEAITTAQASGDLAGRGPFTLFAPTDAAFNALHDTALFSDRARLSRLVECSQVEGLTSLAQLQTLVVDHGGRYQLDTVGGCPLIVTLGAEGGLILSRGSDRTARVTIPDINQENGVVHVIDAVLLPE